MNLVRKRTRTKYQKWISRSLCHSRGPTTLLSRFVYWLLTTHLHPVEHFLVLKGTTTEKLIKNRVKRVGVPYTLSEPSNPSPEVLGTGKHPRTGELTPIQDTKRRLFLLYRLLYPTVRALFQGSLYENFFVCRYIVPFFPSGSLGGRSSIVLWSRDSGRRLSFTWEGVVSLTRKKKNLVP